MTFYRLLAEQMHRDLCERNILIASAPQLRAQAARQGTSGTPTPTTAHAPAQAGGWASANQPQGEL